MEGNELQPLIDPEEREGQDNEGYNDDYIDDILKDDETSFSEPPNVPYGEPGRTRDAAGRISDIRGDFTRDNLVHDFYKAIDRDYGLSPTNIDYDRFVVGKDGELKLRVKNRRFQITSTAGTSKFLSLGTIARKIGGVSAVRKYLNLPDYKSKSKPTPAFENLERKVDEAAKADDEDLYTAADNVVGALSAATQTDGLTFRELSGLDEALKTYRGAKAVQESKKVSLQQTLDGLREDLERPGTSERTDQIEREIQKAEEQLAATQESIDTLNLRFRSQLSQIRETLTRVFDLESDATLAERVRTLFREQGVTIASIITAIGMAISTLVLAIAGGGTPAPTPAPTPPKPSDKGGVKEWVKKQLQSLGRVLANLAGKAAAALPGIIGSIVSWLLNLLAKAAGWLAGNLWAVVVAVGGLLLVAAREWLA